MPRHRTGTWLLLIVLLGLTLRLSGLTLGQGYFYFGQGDGVEAYSRAVDYGRGEARAQYIGQPNYNAHAKLPGPLWTIFCFLGLRLGGSVQGIIVATILLNTVTIYLVYLLAKRTLGETKAVWAALFCATPALGRLLLHRRVQPRSDEFPVQPAVPGALAGNTP